jgi:hypothetical protein
MKYIPVIILLFMAHLLVYMLNTESHDEIKCFSIEDVKEKTTLETNIKKLLRRKLF